MWQMFQQMMAAGGQPVNSDITGSVESDAPIQGNHGMPQEYGVGWNAPREQVERRRLVRRRQ
jgi:hypothetical protein